MNEKLPKLSFVVPVLNEEKRLITFLDSVVTQDYPRDLIEIIIADGGSVDASVEIAKRYGAIVLPNKLKTSESGKAVGVKNATGDFIVFTDADNVLPNTSWLKKMLFPLFQEPDIIGSEPLYFTYRKTDGFIDRYCALIGMNDPLCYWLGSYDRFSLLSNKWTGLNVVTEDKGEYLKLTLENGNIPTIGANGTVIRAKVFRENPGLFTDYLFDMDILEQLTLENGSQKFAKVNEGIIHLYCGSSVRKFIRKQMRRIRDFLFRSSVSDTLVKRDLSKRKYTYGKPGAFNLLLGIMSFVVACVFVVPLFVQMVQGFLRKKDVAWLAHPLLCWITLIVYARGTLESFFVKEEYSRKNWK